MPRHVLAAGLLVAAAALAGCGDDAPSRTQQAADIASSAGLPADVADFFALASRTDGTYQVVYDTTASDGSKLQLTVYQRPPDRRLDAFLADGTIESSIRKGDLTYQCTKSSAGWRCGLLTTTDAPADGVLPADSVAKAVAAFRQRADTYDFKVEERTLVGVVARCLVTTVKASVTTQAGTGASGTICVSPEGAPLLTQVPRGSVAASSYRTDVPAGVFDLPATPDTTPPTAGSTTSAAPN